MPLLEAKDLILCYPDVQGIVKAVDDVSFSLERGEALGIVGESGCGKTSLALLLTRLLPPNVETCKGSVLLDGEDLMGISHQRLRNEIWWRRISIVFQGAMNSLNPVVKIGTQVAEPLIVHRGLHKKDANQQVRSLLETVGLQDETFHRYAHELSGGMKQRVMLAMALVLRPEIVILDEPTSALDVVVQAQIMNLLKRLKKDHELSLLFITHDIALSSDICDRIGVMYAGELIEIGDAEHLLQRPSHPYAEALLASVPRLRSDTKPRFIPGAPPDLRRPPSGCRFHPRCAHAFELCNQKTPPCAEIHSGHTANCWLRVNRHE